jgi:hypothetical protein
MHCTGLHFYQKYILIASSVINDTTGLAKVERYRGEPAIVLQVSLLGLDTPTEAQKASIKLSINVCDVYRLLLTVDSEILSSVISLPAVTARRVF